MNNKKKTPLVPDITDKNITTTAAMGVSHSSTGSLHTSMSPIMSNVSRCQPIPAQELDGPGPSIADDCIVLSDYEEKYQSQLPDRRKNFAELVSSLHRRQGRKANKEMERYGDIYSPLDKKCNSNVAPVEVCL